MRGTKSLIALGTCVGFGFASDFFFQSNQEEICKFLFNRTNYKINYTNISGKLFWGRKTTFSGFRIYDQNGNIDIEIDQLKIKTSILSLLFGPNYFLKSLEITGMHGKITKYDSTSNCIHHLSNIKASNSKLLLGSEPNLFSLQINSLNTSKYGLNISHLFSHIEFNGLLDDRKISFQNIPQNIPQTSKNPLETNFSPVKNPSNLSTVKTVPETFKYQMHYSFSSVLLRNKRRFQVEIVPETLLKVLVFFDVPFVFEGEINEDSRFVLDAVLQPGRNYGFEGRLEWKEFLFPRVVTKDPRWDQFWLFLNRFFVSRSSFVTEFVVFYEFRQKMLSDKAEEVEAVFKVADSIFGMGIRDFLDE